MSSEHETYSAVKEVKLENLNAARHKTVECGV